jgi:pimeloyl-ACP methyl ester carboxylesterase
MRRSISNLLTLLVIAVLALSACRPAQTPTPPPTAAPTQTPADTPTPKPTLPPSPTPTLVPAQFIGSSCPFKTPPGLSEGVNLECGYLIAPADRDNPDSGVVQLAVAILRHPDGDPEADPILYLEGGPGGSALEFLNLIYERRFAPVFEAGRDIILFDQRGVGLSRPALDCPEQDELFFELLDNEKDGQALSEAEMDQLNLDAMAACAANLASKADLADYSTDASAADVKDLAQALGYTQVNLWGTSYGTRLALEVLRDYPEIVRSAVLDSSLPPEVNLYDEQPTNFGRSLSLLFEGCAADSADGAETCNTAYPDLETVFYDTVDALNAENLTFTATDPISGKSYETAISGDNFVELIFQFLYDSDIIPLLPRLIYDVSQGKSDLLALLVGSLIASQSAVSDGMHQAVQCAEEIAFNSPEAMQAAAAGLPELAGYFDEGTINSAFDTCAAMKITASDDPTVSQPVESEIPTLVLAGEFDPITPPAWGEQVTQGLANSHFFEYPGMGHAPSLSDACARGMLVSFIQNPDAAPSDACMDAMGPPKWVTPPPTDVTLVPWQSQDYGIRGVVPEGWPEVSPGVFSRQHSSLDVALVLSQAAPMSASSLLAQISRQVGLAQPPQPVGEQQEGNGLTWTLYSFNTRGVQVDMALAEDEGKAYMVLLQSSPDERDNLYQKVFLPMLDELEVL